MGKVTNRGLGLLVGGGGWCRRAEGCQRAGRLVGAPGRVVCLSLSLLCPWIQALQLMSPIYLTVIALRHSELLYLLATVLVAVLMLMYWL